MMGNILPAHVEAVEVLGDDPTARLMPEEEHALGPAAEGRRKEFTTARNCARLALSKLGLPPTAILRGPNREPCWPAGLVGSITHCPGYRVAAVARREHFLSIGIDAEVHEALPPGVVQVVARSEELDWLQTVQQRGVWWDRVLFSAKESVYKAWYPLAGKWLGFKDALVQIDPANGTFRASLLTTGPIIEGLRLDRMEGRFCIRNGLILTFVGIPARPGERP